MLDTTQKVANKLSNEHLNIIVGRNAPPATDIQILAAKDYDTVIKYFSIEGGHPETIEDHVLGAVDCFDKELAKQNPTAVFIRTNRYEALKEAEVYARENGLTLRWIVCDEEVEVTDDKMMPGNSIVDYHADLFDRDLEIAFSG